MPKSKLTSPFDGASNYIKGHDLFGAGVNFNFGGAPNYKTVPGGCVSIFIKICFYSYAILQMKYMLLKETWSLNQQTVLQTQEELRIPLPFRGQDNVTVGIQFNQKRRALTEA